MVTIPPYQGITTHAYEAATRIAENLAGSRPIVEMYAELIHDHAVIARELAALGKHLVEVVDLYQRA
jgi:hypothetical protein